MTSAAARAASSAVDRNGECDIFRTDWRLDGGTLSAGNKHCKREDGLRQAGLSAASLRRARFACRSAARKAFLPLGLLAGGDLPCLTPPRPFPTFPPPQGDRIFIDAINGKPVRRTRLFRRCPRNGIRVKFVSRDSISNHCVGRRGKVIRMNLRRFTREPGDRPFGRTSIAAGDERAPTGAPSLPPAVLTTTAMRACMGSEDHANPPLRCGDRCRVLLASFGPGICQR